MVKIMGIDEAKGIIKLYTSTNGKMVNLIITPDSNREELDIDLDMSDSDTQYYAKEFSKAYSRMMSTVEVTVTSTTIQEGVLWATLSNGKTVFVTNSNLKELEVNTGLSAARIEELKALIPVVVESTNHSYFGREKDSMDSAYERRTEAQRKSQYRPGNNEDEERF